MGKQTTADRDRREPEEEYENSNAADLQEKTYVALN